MFSFLPSPAPFMKILRCINVDEMNDRSQLDYSGKIHLPGSCLHQIMMMRENDETIMMFTIENLKNKIKTCVGVLEFTAKEGTVIVPTWLKITPGTSVKIEMTEPRLGEYARFQPLSYDFLDIIDPKIVLEKALRKYTCISIYDCIEINYCDKTYQLLIKETKPEDSICLINCNLTVEFDSPPGYEEFQENLKMERCTLNIQDRIYKFVENSSTEFQPFQGNSSRLDGRKKKKTESLSTSINENSLNTSINSGYPDYEWKFGKITFDRYFHKRVQKETDEKIKVENDLIFPGPGNRIPTPNLSPEYLD